MLSSLIMVAALTATSTSTSCDVYYGPYYYHYYPAPRYYYAPVYYVQLPYIVPCFPVEVVVDSSQSKEAKEAKTREGDTATKLEKKLDALTDLLLNFEKRLDRLEKRLDKLEKDAGKPAPKESRLPEEINRGQRALVTVRLPAEAVLYLDGQPTRHSHQAVRTILTPELEPGASYSYDLSASFIRNGQTFTQSRRITFQAGGRVEVTFGELDNRGSQGR